ncbi:MAG: O-methyltransferase [Bacteroidales bacterium]|jgi:caffeoyl-CoA O-methyltransferase|nr:O-methyltransferase [Bacteroidales bacterium]
MDEALETYVLDHTGEEPELLRRLERDTKVRLLNGRMVSGRLQGRLLVMLCRMIKPRKILELGTFTGYSALCLAEGSAPDTEVHTIEHNDELETTIQDWFAQSPYKNQLHLHIGEALEVLPTLEGPFDLVYLDLDKRAYLPCLQAVLPMVPSGGFILADNTLWGGKVLKPIAPSDTQTLAISEFNRYIATHSGLETVLLPLRDGLTLIRKK